MRPSKTFYQEIVMNTTVYYVLMASAILISPNVSYDAILRILGLPFPVAFFVSIFAEYLRNIHKAKP